MFSIADGVISLKDLKRVGSVGGKTFVYYICTTALAVVIGLLLVSVVKNMNAFDKLPDENIAETVEAYNEKQAASSAKTTEDLAKDASKSPAKLIMDLLVSIFPKNFLDPMVKDNMLQVIVIAIFLGAGVLAAGEKGQKIGELINCGQAVIMKILMMIINFTPIGVFCLMSWVVAAQGPKILGSLGLVLLAAYIGYIIHTVLVYSLSVKVFAGMSPFAFFKGILPAAVFAFTSTSSVASLPVSKECCDEMGVEKDISSFVLPLGATINMDGTAIYQCVAAIFLAKCIGMELGLAQMVTIVVTATLASIGTAGTSGAGMIMLAMVLEAVGIPTTYIGIIYGIDRLFDMGRTALNVVGDASCAICVNHWESKAAAKKVAK